MSANSNSPKDINQSFGELTPKEEQFRQKFDAELDQFTGAKPKFPTHGLPKSLLDFATDVSEVYNVPIEFPIMSAFCAISAALRKKFVLFDGRYYNYAQLWVMIVSPSGVGKTQPMELAFKKLQELDKRSFEAYQLEFAEWKNECASNKKNGQAEQPKPSLKQTLVDDFTPESLYQTMFDNNEAISIYRDELEGWFSDFGRYTKSGEISRYLSIFGNSQFTITRKSEEPKLISKPFLTLCGSIQPQVLDKVLSTNLLKENGFASRFLYVYCDKLKKAKYSDKVANDALINDYNMLIEHCYNLPAVIEPITLITEAKAIFVSFSDAMTDKINNTENGFLRASYSKLEIHVQRIALLVYIIRSVYNDNECQAMQVTAEAMEYAVNLGYYFAHSIEEIETNEPQQTISKADAIKSLFQHGVIKSFQQFADAIGVSRQYVSKICNP